MKYICADVKLGSVTFRVSTLFDEKIVHDQMGAAFLGVCRATWPKAKIKLATAGFAEPASVYTHGKSETLKLSSDPEDGTRISLANYGFNIVES